MGGQAGTCSQLCTAAEGEISRSSPVMLSPGSVTSLRQERSCLHCLGFPWAWHRGSDRSGKLVLLSTRFPINKEWPGRACQSFKRYVKTFPSFLRFPSTSWVHPAQRFTRGEGGKHSARTREPFALRMGFQAHLGAEKPQLQGRQPLSPAHTCTAALHSAKLLEA